MTSQMHETGDLFFLGIMRAARKLTRYFDDGLHPVRLTSGQFCILASLNSAQSISITPLANRLAMDRTTLTAALKRLQREKLVSVVVGVNDNRCRTVSITSSGRRKLLRALPIWAEKCRALAGILQADDLFEDIQEIGSALSKASDPNRIH